MHQDGQWPPSSRQPRRRAGLGVRAGPGAEQVRRAVEPEHALRLPIGRRYRRLRGLNGRAGISGAADGTAAVVRELIMQGVRSRDQVPGDYAPSSILTARFLAWAPGNNLTLPVFLRGPPYRAFFAGQRACRSAYLGGRMQPAVAKFRSFRRLL